MATPAEAHDHVVLLVAAQAETGDYRGVVGAHAGAHDCRDGVATPAEARDHVVLLVNVVTRAEARDRRRGTV